MDKMWHPNKVPFEGVLAVVDRPSSRPPGGARGHRVVLTREAASEALPFLVGMAVSYSKDFNDHDVHRKCGVIDSACLNGDRLYVSGYLYGRDFPDIVQMLDKRDNGLGMSYEMADVHIEDMRAEVWMIRKGYFIGAAILWRHKAAYRQTFIGLIGRSRSIVPAVAHLKQLAAQS